MISTSNPDRFLGIFTPRIYMNDDVRDLPRNRSRQTIHDELLLCIAAAIPFDGHCTGQRGPLLGATPPIRRGAWGPPSADKWRYRSSSSCRPHILIFRSLEKTAEEDRDRAYCVLFRQTEPQRRHLRPVVRPTLLRRRIVYYPISIALFGDRRDPSSDLQCGGREGGKGIESNGRTAGKPLQKQEERGTQ